MPVCDNYKIYNTYTKVQTVFSVLVEQGAQLGTHVT